jgi:BMFP domain-containing protein YqiC
MYDAIDAQGVGATVMINGVTMAAVAADGYIGNGQYDTTSSGATSGYTTDYADDPIVSTNTGQGYLGPNGEFIEYGALGFGEDYTPTLANLNAAITAAGGVNLTDDEYAETVDFTTTTSGNDYVDAAEADGVTDEQLDDGNGGDDDPIVSTGTGQGYLDADGEFIEYGTDLVDDTKLTDEDILMNMPVNVDTTNLNDFIILTQDGTNGNPITPVEEGQTITSDGGKQVTLPEGIGAVVGEGGTRLIDETTGEVIGFLPNKTVQSSDGVLRFTIYSPSTQALIDNANKILADQVNNKRFFNIAEGIVIADSNRDYSVGGGDQNKGDLGFIPGKYKLPDGVEVSIVTQAEYDALVKKLGATVVENALVKTESDETNLSAFGGLLRKDYTGYSNSNFTGYDRTTGGNTIGVSVGGDNVGQMAIVNPDGSVRIADANGRNTGVVFSGVNAVQDAVDHLSISTGGGDTSVNGTGGDDTSVNGTGGDTSGEDGTGVDGTGGGGTSGGDTSGDGTGGESGGGDGTGVDGTGVAGTGGGDIGGESGGEDGTGVDGTGGGDTGGAGTGVALTSEQVSTIVTDALALLPAYATPTDVTNAITTALEGRNNLSPTDVTNAITTALAGQKNLSDEEVGNIITKIVGSPSTTTVIDGIEVVTDPTGIYAEIKGVGNEIKTAISNLPASPTITEITDAITTVLAGQNNLNEDEVESALKKALEGKFNLNADDIGTIVGNVVGQPSTTTVIDGVEVVTDATGIYAEIKGVGNEIKTAISNLPVSPTITEITDAITTVLAGQNNLNEDEVEAALKKALEGKFNLNADDIDTIVGGVVGHDGQLVFDENGEIVVDANGNPVYSNPTGIYAKIEGVGNEIKTAISNLPVSPTITEITTAITTVLAGQNDLNEDEVEAALKKALEGKFNLNADDIGTIVDGIVGSPSTTTVMEDGTEVVTDPTGIYAKIQGVGNEIKTAISNLPASPTITEITEAITTVLAGQNDLSDKEITTIVTDALSGMNNLSDKEVSTIVGDALSGLNNLSKTDVTTIVNDAISGLNDLSDEEVGDIITKTVGSPSTTTVMDDGTEVVTDATGIYAKIQGLNNLSTDDLSTAINDAIDELPDYATPADVTSAITTAVAALTTGALKTMQDTIDEMGRYETSEDFSVRDIVEEFKRQRKGGMGYGLPSYMQRYMSGNVIDELVREVVLPDGSKFFVTPDGRYLDPEEFIGSKTTGGVQYVSTGDDRYQSGYSTLDTKTGVKTNYDMDGKVIGTSVQPESTLAS